MDKLLMISADNHCGAKAVDYAPYFDPKYRDAAQVAIAEEADFNRITGDFCTVPESVLKVIDRRDAIASGGASGGWDLTERLRQLDAEGIAAEIAYAGCQFQLPPFFTHVGRAHPAHLRSAGARAHHRWFVDFRAPAKERIFGVAESGGCEDMAAAVAELHWCADQGFVAISCPGGIRDDNLPPLYDEYYEPFWQACAERGLVLSIHVGWGRTQGAFFEPGLRAGPDPVLMEYLDTMDPASVRSFAQRLQFAPDLPPRRAFWQLILGGVLDRHPTLKVVFAEVHADWLPDTLAYLDRHFDRERGRARLQPSEYFARQGFVTPTSPGRCEIALRERIGIDKMMLGVDFPHPESTWPNTHEWLADVFQGLSESEVRRFCGGNAIDCFGLDGQHLGKVAANIGPGLDELLQSAPTDPQLIAHFSQRAGYARPAEQVDQELLRVYVAADCADVMA